MGKDGIRPALKVDPELREKLNFYTHREISWVLAGEKPRYEELEENLLALMDKLVAEATRQEVKRIFLLIKSKGLIAFGEECDKSWGELPTNK